MFLSEIVELWPKFDILTTGYMYKSPWVDLKSGVKSGCFHNNQNHKTDSKRNSTWFLSLKLLGLNFKSMSVWQENHCNSYMLEVRKKEFFSQEQSYISWRISRWVHMFGSLFVCPRWQTWFEKASRIPQMCLKTCGSNYSLVSLNNRKACWKFIETLMMCVTGQKANFRNITQQMCI